MKTYAERREDLRQEILAEMRALREAGMTMEEIGRQYGMKRAAVNNFLKGNNRKCGV